MKARKVTDSQIKRYWKEKESERLAGRVHQEELSVEEKVLRLFDMSSQYGVSILHFLSISLSITPEIYPRTCESVIY